MLLKDNTGYDTSNLAATKDFIALKTGVDKVDTDNLINLLSGSSNLKTRGFKCLEVKNWFSRFKKLSDVESNITN